MDFKVPIHCIATVPCPRTDPDAHTLTHDLILVGGGGGPGNTGLVNQLAQLDWTPSSHNELQVTATATFSKNDDAPWSIAVSPDASLVAAGVNTPASDEFNRNCRILARTVNDAPQPTQVTSDSSKASRSVVELKEIKAFVTTAKDKGAAGDYQCAAAFSPNGKYLATGSDAGTLSLLEAPGFVQLDWSPLPVGSKIFNLDFSRNSANVIVTSERALRVYNVESGELLLEAKPPAGHTFRAGRPGPGSLFYTLVNQRRVKCILSVWDLDRPNKPVKSVTLASKPAVSFAIRDDIAAVGLADCSLLLLHSLHHARTLPNVHDVPISALAIARQPSPTSSSSLVIISASGDGQVKVWHAPKPSALHHLVPAITHSPIAVALVALLLAAWFTWLVLGLVVSADELVKAGIPFLSVDGGTVKLVSAHVEWMRNVGLDRVVG